MSTFVGNFWPFVQGNACITFKDREFLCQTKVTFAGTTFVSRRARLYFPFYWKNGALIFELPDVLWESRAVLVLCFVEAMCVVCKTLLEWGLWASNVFSYCVVAGLDGGFGRLMLLVDIDRWVGSCSSLCSCTSLLLYRCLASRWICCDLRSRTSC